MAGLMILFGTDELEINFLRGDSFWEEGIRRYFIGAKWMFFPNKKFLFTAPKNANIRSDLYPISGTCLDTNCTLEIHGEKQSTLGARACVDGVINKIERRFVLNIIYSVQAMGSRKIVKISQILTQNPNMPLIYPEIISGIEVPSIFRIYIMGKTEAGYFGPISGILRIMTRYSEDNNPFHIEIDASPDGTIGCIILSSFTCIRAGQSQSNGEITTRGDEVHLVVKPRKISQVGLGWFTMIHGELANNMPIGVQTRSGTLTFRIQGNEISGEIHATGISDFNQLSTYDAQITGQRYETDSDLYE